MRSSQLKALLFRLFFLYNFLNALQPGNVGASRKRNAYNGQEFHVNGQIQHTLRVSPPYYVVALPRISHILFRCYVDDLPAENGQTLWVRDGYLVPCIATNRVYACGNALVIKRVNFQDKGQYKCVLSDQQWISYMVEIIVPLSLCNPGNSIVTLSRGADRQLDCCVSNKSYPRPQNVLWSLNDEYIAIQPSLQLKNFHQNQTGVYECSAFNGFGNLVSKKFFVTFSDVGGRNLSLHVGNVSQTDSQAEGVQNQVKLNGQMTDSGMQSFYPGWLYITLCFIYQTV